MKSVILLAAISFSFCLSASAQSLANNVIRERIWTAKADKSITLTYEPSGKTSKIMGVSENFAKSESGRAGLLAMNFAIGLLYPGEELSKSPETFLFTFWVMTKKPRFSENHAMTAALAGEMLVVGTARYISKPAQQMEYLNFEVTRETLSKIAAGSDVRFQLGDDEFTFTKSQMKLMADILTVTTVE